MTKHSTKKIRTSFLVNIFIFIFLLGIISFFIYPDYNKIEAKKITFGETIKTYYKIKNEGITIKKFNSQIKKDITKLKKEKVKNKQKINSLEEILNSKNILIKFLEEKEKKDDFLTYIEKKKNFILKKINNSEIESLENKLEKILPSYVEGDENLSTLTDFKFINYLENLFFSFNLKNDGSIGIGNIVAVDYFSSTKKTPEIFYIPTKFKITGKKGNILNFLYYLENVGKIDLIKVFNKKTKQKNLKILFYKDNFFKNIPNLESLIPSINENYKNENKLNQIIKDNIYNNLFADIKTIKFNKYIDSHLVEHDSSSKELFIDYIKNSQSNDKYSIEITVNFYIKGLPKYKLNNYIKNLILNFNKLNKEVTKELKQAVKNNNNAVIPKLASFNKFLKKEQKNISTISKKAKKPEELIKIYNSTKNIDNKLKDIKKVLQKIKLEKLEEEFKNLQNKVKKTKADEIKLKNLNIDIKLFILENQLSETNIKKDNKEEIEKIKKQIKILIKNKK